MFHMWAVGPAEILPIIGDPRIVGFKIGVMLTNRGPGIARDVFLNVVVWPPEGPSEVSYSFPVPADWQGGVVLQNRAQIISKDHVKLAPEAIITPLVILVKLQPPFLTPFVFELSYGHGGSPTTKVEGRTMHGELELAFARTVLHRDEEGARAFMQSLFQ